jgi:Holliday junction resolvase RusA-like endonuclease
MIDTTGGLWDIQEAVEVRLVFFFQRQESVNGGPVPTHDTQWPTAITLGDADKLTRNVLDALTDSRMIRDDSLVTHLMVAKMWVPEDMAPGVQVLVMPAPDESDMPPWWVK